MARTPNAILGDNIIARRAQVPWKFVARIRRHRVGASVKKMCDAHGVLVKDLEKPKQHSKPAAARKAIVVWMKSVGYTYDEIGELFGIDRSSARRICRPK